MTTFLLFFGLQFLLYFLVTVNFRAIADARYGWTILTDALISASQFWIIRKVGTSADSTVAWTGFVCGGAVGSTIGIWLSKRLFGKTQPAAPADAAPASVASPVSGWQKFSTVITCLQLVVVITSVLLIRSQLHQQVDLNRYGNTQSLVGLVTPLDLRTTDPQIAGLWVMGDEGIDKITDITERRTKRQQYQQLVANYLVFYENVYSQYKNGVLDQEIYDGWRADLASFICQHKIARHWNERRQFYRPDFRSDIDSLIARPCPAPSPE